MPMMTYFVKRKILMLPTIDLAIEDDVSINETDFLARIENILERTVTLADLRFPQQAELSLVLAGDETLRLLNKEWRNKDKPTNVLSFPGDDISIGEEAGLVLGDIVISLETTEREAALENKAFEDHLSHLVIHGFLHLFGYDHQTEKEANRMESLETKILNEFGIANPY